MFLCMLHEEIFQFPNVVEFPKWSAESSCRRCSIQKTRKVIPMLEYIFKCVSKGSRLCKYLIKNILTSE